MKRNTRKNKWLGTSHRQSAAVKWTVNTIRTETALHKNSTNPLVAAVAVVQS